MQGQSQETDHLNPMVALVQMGPLVGQDLLAGFLGHTGGDIDFRLDEAQDKGGFNPVGFPAPGDLHRVHHPQTQPDVRYQAVDADDRSYNDPDSHQDGGKTRRNRNADVLGL